MAENIVNASSGLIPFGDKLGAFIGAKYGFRDININDGTVRAKLLEVGAKLLGEANNIAGVVSTGATIAEAFGYSSAALSKMGIVGTIFSLLVTGGNVAYQVSQRISVDLDFIIDQEFGNLLSASTHDNVAVLYFCAKEKMKQLYKQGDFSYSRDSLGLIRVDHQRNGAFDEIRQDLQRIRTTLGE